MRALSVLILLLAISAAAYAKKPSAANPKNFEHVSLFFGNVQLDIPQTMRVDSQYFHYWDNCPNGGYTVSFKSKCSKKQGVSMQLHVHDLPASSKELHDGYDPHKQCLDNLTVLRDTVFAANGRMYTLVATLAKPGKNGGKYAGARTNNYTLSYYINAEGRTLELHYNYWSKDAAELKHWQRVSAQVAASVKWQSSAWTTTAQK